MAKHPSEEDGIVLWDHHAGVLNNMDGAHLQVQAQSQDDFSNHQLVSVRCFRKVMAL